MPSKVNPGRCFPAVDGRTAVLRAEDGRGPSVRDAYAPEDDGRAGPAVAGREAPGRELPKRAAYAPDEDGRDRAPYNPGVDGRVPAVVGRDPTLDVPAVVGRVPAVLGREEYFTGVDGRPLKAEADAGRDIAEVGRVLPEDLDSFLISSRSHSSKQLSSSSSLTTLFCCCSCSCCNLIRSLGLIQ